MEYHVHIWQMSLQLSCGDICQIWMWFEESNLYFCKIENFPHGEINERSLSNPTRGVHEIIILPSLQLYTFFSHDGGE